jgi:YgiT-type zinc finger domain-containing protein
MIKIKERKCPICGDGSLKKEVIIETFNYKRESVAIPNYVIWLCSECGEAIVDNETLKESGKILKAFIRELDGGS